MPIDLSQDEHDIKVAHRPPEGGTQLWFDEGCKVQPWSWRDMFVSISRSKAPEEFFATGVVALHVMPIPNSVDPHRVTHKKEEFGTG